MSDNIVKIQTQKAAKELNESNTETYRDDIGATVESDTNNILENLSVTVVSYCSNLIMINENKKKIMDFIGKRCGLSVNVNPVTINHAPHIKRHATMGVLPTIGDDEYAELLFPGIIKELGKHKITINQSPAIMDAIGTLRSLIANVANLVIQTITLRNPDIYKKCFEVSVTPDKTVTSLNDDDTEFIDQEPEREYCKEMEAEILKMGESSISKDDILYLFDHYLF